LTEAEWLKSNDPTALLEFLLEQGLSERKARLLACACCRRVWPLLPDPRSRTAVEVGERFADGLASAVELARARNAAGEVCDRRSQKAEWAAYWSANAKLSGVEGPLPTAFDTVATAAVRQAAEQTNTDQFARFEAASAATQRAHAELIREVAGNPFRPPVVEPHWLAWHRGVVTALAEAIYEERAFDRLPILADALEDVGCTECELLAHLRSGKEHVPGCWALDAVLGNG
jgi:hypothetical protein